MGVDWGCDGVCRLEEMGEMKESVDWEGMGVCMYVTRETLFMP